MTKRNILMSALAGLIGFSPVNTMMDSLYRKDKAVNTRDKDKVPKEFQIAAQEAAEKKRQRKNAKRAKHAQGR